MISLALAGFLAVPAPEGWRQSIEGPFSLFLPPEVRRVGPKKFDSIAGQFAADGLRVSYDWGYYVPRCENGDRSRIGGRSVELVRAAGTNGFFTLTACFDAVSRGAKRLTIRFESSGEAAAEDAETALATIRFSAKPEAPR